MLANTNIKREKLIYNRLHQILSVEKMHVFEQQFNDIFARYSSDTQYLAYNNIIYYKLEQMRKDQL